VRGVVATAARAEAERERAHLLETTSRSPVWEGIRPGSAEHVCETAGTRREPAKGSERQA